MESCTVSGYEVIVCEPAAQSSRVGVLLRRWGDCGKTVSCVRRMSGCAEWCPTGQA